MARSLVTIEDLSNQEIEAVFALADEFVAKLGEPGRPHRVRGRLPLAEDVVIATLFFEPSTRTRLSFESAMHRLGGHILTSADPRTSSAVKGETIADTVRVVETYAELIVMRHPWEGAPAVAAEFAEVPIINAGDGSHEHPTQTLCDLYTLRCEKGGLRDLNVVICGDLKHGRTVHSLVYGLARFGARIITYPAKGLELPQHVVRRLRDEFGGTWVRADQIDELPSGWLPGNGIYTVPDQLSLGRGQAESVHEIFARHSPFKTIDAVYVTRPQGERRREGEAGAADYPVVDTSFLKERRYRESRVMHPLPRVSELGYEMDVDSRAIYFKQASYGIPVRMALLAALLRLRPGLLAEGPAAGSAPPHVSRGGLTCGNEACVSNQESERRYLKPKFKLLGGDPLLVRCHYCDHEATVACVGRADRKKYDTHASRVGSIPAEELVLFASESAAREAGFEPYRTPQRAG
jgi:aspartate carbamoyltransferase catalytic subunit